MESWQGKTRDTLEQLAAQIHLRVAASNANDLTEEGGLLMAIAHLIKRSLYGLNRNL